MPTVTPRNDSVEIAPIIGRRHEVRRWLANAAICLAVLVPLILMLAGLGAKAGVWSWGFGLGTMTAQWARWLAMLAIGLGVVSLLLGLFLAPRSKRAIIGGALAVMVGAATIGSLLNLRATAGANPIHDITTDTQNPPVFGDVIVGERAQVERANTLDYVGKTLGEDGELVSVVQSRLYPDLKPLVISDAPEVAFARAEAAVRGLGWDIKDTDAGAGTIEATDTTFWYGFEDDVVIRIRPGAGGGSVVDVRSVSRVGGSDLGANAERVRDFFDAFGA